MGVFHERLKELKDSSGKTQAQIAEALGITPQNLSYYFNGREPNYDLLIKIAEFFDVSTDYLLGRSYYKKPLISQNISSKHSIYAASGEPDPIAEKDKKIVASISETFYKLLKYCYKSEDSSYTLLTEFDKLLKFISSTLDSDKSLEEYRTLIRVIRHEKYGLTHSNLNEFRFKHQKIDACIDQLYLLINVLTKSLFDKYDKLEE